MRLTSVFSKYSKISLVSNIKKKKSKLYSCYNFQKRLNLLNIKLHNSVSHGPQRSPYYNPQT